MEATAEREGATVASCESEKAQAASQTTISAVGKPQNLATLMRFRTIGISSRHPSSIWIDASGQIVTADIIITWRALTVTGANSFPAECRRLRRVWSSE
jgi:hypothetical protein